MKNIGDDARIPISEAAARYGRHVRTLERWIDDPSVAFPKPVYIRRQRYIRAGDLKAWEESHAA